LADLYMLNYTRDNGEDAVAKVWTNSPDEARNLATKAARAKGRDDEATWSNLAMCRCSKLHVEGGTYDMAPLSFPRSRPAARVLPDNKDGAGALPRPVLLTGSGANPEKFRLLPMWAIRGGHLAVRFTGAR
jgi:hypothetical protein